jgi:hemerythrin-like domain-containing protein
MRPAIAMARQVEQNFDRFVEEHRGITRALDELEAAAKAEGNSDALHFAEALRAHAQTEEDVFYPMTIVIGRYLQRELDGR